MNDSARRGELRRFSAGPLEDITEPCRRCSVDVVHKGVQAAGTPFGDLQRKAGSYCPSCIADMDEEDAARTRAEETRKAAERRRDALANAGLPPAFAEASFQRCREGGMPEHAVAAAERWGAGKLRGLLLTGPVGVGKSTLAAAAVLARIGAEGRAAFWTSAPALFAALSGDFDNPARQRALAVLEGGRALALDDIDKGRPSHYGAEMTWLAVDQRIVHNAPLLVTTNSGLDALSERWPEEYAEAIVSRLVGHCELVAIEGVDRRVPRAA
jgi:DNA replication protein DnaC